MSNRKYLSIGEGLLSCNLEDNNIDENLKQKLKKSFEDDQPTDWAPIYHPNGNIYYEKEWLIDTLCRFDHQRKL